MLALAMRALVVLMVAACGAAAPAVQPAASREGDAWPRVHQLLDRFDQARFGGDAAARERPLVLATCLYPLYDADPEPYFDPDPARRPPPPAWEELEARLDELYAPLRGSASRVAPAATVLAEKRRPMLREAAARGLLPQPLDPRALGVPAVTDPALALPYDWEPFIVVQGERGLEASPGPPFP